MKLARLRLFSPTMAYATGQYVMSRGRTLDEVTTVIVEATASDGTVGYGESCTLGATYIDGFPGSVRAAVELLAPRLLGMDVRETRSPLHLMDAVLLGHTSAKAVIDAALWDLRGQLLDVSVATLLGGRQQEDYAVFHPLSLGDTDAMVEELRTRRADGYRCWQLKLGDDPIADAERVVATMAELDGDYDFLTCDANAGWTRADTVAFLNKVGTADVYVEQPCSTLDDLTYLRQKSRLPFVADEVIVTAADLLRCYAAGSAEAINIKPARVGGLTKAALLRDMAEQLGLRVIIDEPMGGALAVAGIAALAGSTSPSCFLSASHVVAEHLPLGVQPWVQEPGVRLAAGRARTPTTPGLGVSVDQGQLGEVFLDVSLAEVGT